MWLQKKALLIAQRSREALAGNELTQLAFLGTMPRAFSYLVVVVINIRPNSPFDWDRLGQVVPGPSAINIAGSIQICRRKKSPTAGVRL